MKIIFYLSLSILQLFSHFLLAQQVEKVSASYDNTSGTMEIFYDLVGYQSEHEKYIIQIFYSIDEGKTYNQIFEATGDIGDAIEPGKGKKIRWDYFVENPEFSGENVIFKVEAKWNRSFEVRRLQSLGGAKSAFNSLLIPGWGHHLVSGKKNNWWTSAVVYSLVAGGGYFALSAQRKFNDYKLTQDDAEAKNLLNQANQKGKTAVLLLATGGTLWLSNVVWVAIRGNKNKKALKKLSAYHFDSPIQLDWNTYTRSTGFKLNFRF